MFVWFLLPLSFAASEPADVCGRPAHTYWAAKRSFWARAVSGQLSLRLRRPVP